jgi:hypothetical protein
VREAQLRGDKLWGIDEETSIGIVLLGLAPTILELWKELRGI